MAKKQPVEFHRLDEAQAYADEHGGIVTRDRLWLVTPDSKPAKSYDEGDSQ